MLKLIDQIWKEILLHEPKSSHLKNKYKLIHYQELQKSGVRILNTLSVGNSAHWKLIF